MDFHRFSLSNEETFQEFFSSFSASKKGFSAIFHILRIKIKVTIFPPLFRPFHRCSSSNDNFLITPKFINFHEK